MKSVLVLVDEELKNDIFKFENNFNNLYSNNWINKIRITKQIAMSNFKNTLIIVT